MNNRILVGSTRFFKDKLNFISKDRDYVELVEEPVGFQFIQQISGPYCLFKWKRMSPEEFINYSLSKGPAMQVGKFLVPEFVNEIGFTIEHLKQLEPLINRLDEGHIYEKIIFDAYIENNDFILTEEQLDSAYQAYVESRKSK